MSIQELENLRLEQDFTISLPFSISSITEYEGKLVINNKIAIPIEKQSSLFKTGLDISIYNEKKDEIGLLVFTIELGDVNINSLTEGQFIAFLTEANITDTKKSYSFKKNYVVLNFENYEEYKTKYMLYAPIWGDFFHPNSGIATTSHSVNILNINAAELHFPADIFLENSIRAVAQPFAFERYLKSYHLLELLFDFEVINKIKNLDIATHSEKIGELLNDYSNKEIKRLEDILETYCKNLIPIISSLNNVSAFVDLAYDLFYKFGTGKEGNPFNGQESKLKNVLSTGFDEMNLQNLKINFHGSYRKFIIKVACYFIYRTRSSIAHNKIGEYILSMSNENFIVEFAEPLLKEILIQCFKK